MFIFTYFYVFNYTKKNNNYLKLTLFSKSEANKKNEY